MVMRHIELVAIGRNMWSAMFLIWIKLYYMCGKTLFCFCKFCIDGGDGPCENYTHVQPWDLVTLKPCSSIDARCDLDIDDMRKVSRWGVISNLFRSWQLFCYCNYWWHRRQCWFLGFIERLYMVIEEKHVNTYGQMFFYGNQIVINKYFKQQGRSSYSYVQCDIGEAYIYSHLIRAMKFQMIKSSHRQKGGKLVY